MADGTTHIGRRQILVGGAALLPLAALGACRIGSGDDAPRDEGAAPVARPPVTDVGLAAGSALLWASDDEVARTLDVAVQAKVQILRFDVSWYFAEPEQGQYEWGPSDRIVRPAVDRGLRPLATVTNTPAWAAIGGRRQTGRPVSAAAYAEFAGKVADRYHDSVGVFEIWNEPNGRMFFEPAPDAAFYAEMLRLAYQSIKAVDAKAVVIGGALGATDHTPEAVAPVDFLKDMYAGGVQGHFDALSYHPYDYGAPLAVGALYRNSPMSQMVEMHDVMKDHGDGGKRIWLTEYGAPSSRIGTQAQARLIGDSLREWQEVDYAGPFIVHTVRDHLSVSTQDEDTFGVATDDYAPKPAMVELTSALTGGLTRREVDARFTRERDPQLGAAVTPIFELQGGYGQRHENGFRYETQRGFRSAPLDVGEAALPWRLVPNSDFADGFQDFGAGSDLRVFSHDDFGTHAIFGAILDAWKPSLGVPVTDEYLVDGGSAGEKRVVDFEHGSIAWSEDTGAEIGTR